MADSSFGKGTSVYRSPEIMSREIEDETVLLDPEHGTYFTLNTTGGAVWSMIESPATLESVLHQLLERFDVGEDTAWQQLCLLLGDLRERGLIQVGDG